MVGERGRAEEGEDIFEVAAAGDIVCIVPGIHGEVVCDF